MLRIEAAGMADAMIKARVYIRKIGQRAETRDRTPKQCHMLAIALYREVYTANLHLLSLYAKAVRASLSCAYI